MLGIFKSVICVVIFVHHGKATERSKCDTRQSSYERCHTNHADVTIWCDTTNLKGVPHPSRGPIESQFPPSYVKAIYINTSCVDKLEPGILELYKRIEFFNCDDNEVTLISSHTFAWNTQLRNLTLSNNRISRIEDDAFAGQGGLENLDLRGNRLREADHSTFHHLVGLASLDLSHNQLRLLSRDAFHEMTRLRTLNLAGNHLRQISPFAFSGLSQLRTLNASSNQLSNLEEGIFHFSKSISVVDVSHNNLSCIHKDIFKGKREVTEFRISHNKLNVPRPEWFRSVHRNWRKGAVQGELLANNSWSCDCRAFLYWRFLDSDVTERRVKKLLDIRCPSLLNDRGKKLSSLPKQHFQLQECRISSEDCSNDVAPPAFSYVPLTPISAPTKHYPPEEEISPSVPSETITVKTPLGVYNPQPSLGPAHGEPASESPTNLIVIVAVVVACAAVVVFVIVGLIYCVRKPKRSDKSKPSNNNEIERQQGQFLVSDVQQRYGNESFTSVTNHHVPSPTECSRSDHIEGRLSYSTEPTRPTSYSTRSSTTIPKEPLKPDRQRIDSGCYTEEHDVFPVHVVSVDEQARHFRRAPPPKINI